MGLLDGQLLTPIYVYSVYVDTRELFIFICKPGQALIVHEYLLGLETLFSQNVLIRDVDYYRFCFSYVTFPIFPLLHVPLPQIQRLLPASRRNPGLDASCPVF